MTKHFRIAVADDESDMREYFQKILPRLGHQVVAVAGDGRELVEVCSATLPDLVITDIMMPEMNGFSAAEELFRERQTPVILISAYHDSTLSEWAETDHIMAHLVKPITQSDLQTGIAVAMRRFNELLVLERQAPTSSQALSDRRTIEKAKAILMKRGGMTETQTFERLQVVANEKGLRLVELAEAALVVEKLLAPW